MKDGILKSFGKRNGILKMTNQIDEFLTQATGFRIDY